MATTDEERYLRWTFLLLKGTLFIVKKVLIRKGQNEFQLTGRNLDALLKANKKKLEHEFRHKKQREKLFPTSGKTNVEDWDISLLVGVLQIVFRPSLSKDEHHALKTIKLQRNDVYAHRATVGLDTDSYTDICDDLQNAFDIMASGFDSEIQQECNNIIKSCLKGELDIKSHLEQLKRNSETDYMLSKIIAKIEAAVKENKEENSALKRDISEKISQSERSICDAIIDAQLKKEDVTAAVLEALQGQQCSRKVKKVKVVDSQLDVSGDDKDQLNINLAENIIMTVTNEAIRRAETPEEYTRIREIIQEILDEIKSHSGVIPLAAEMGCVIIRFNCSTYEQLFSFMTYMDSEAIKERLNKLGASLSCLLNTKEKLHVSISLTLKTLQSIIDELGIHTQRQYKRSVRIPIQVESLEGMNRVLDLFEGGGLTNNLNKLSEALSETVGARINVKPSINTKQLMEALEDFDQVEESNETDEHSSDEEATDYEEESAMKINITEDHKTDERQNDYEEESATEINITEEQKIDERQNDYEEESAMEINITEEQKIDERQNDYEEESAMEINITEEQKIDERQNGYEEESAIDIKITEEHKTDERQNGTERMARKEETNLKEVSIWLQLVLSLEKTKVSLGQYVLDIWKEQIRKWHTTEDLETVVLTFLECVAKGNIKYEKREWKCKCRHRSCATILEDLLSLQQNPGPSVVWNSSLCENIVNELQSQQNSQSYGTENIPGRETTVLQRILQFFSKPLQWLQTKGRNVNFEDMFVDCKNEYVWCIANMFMQRGKATSKINNTGPDDTDAAMFFRMMKNCKLFDLKGDNYLYADILLCRDRLFHSPNNRIKREEAESYFNTMTSLLKKFDNVQECKDAIESIEQMRNETISIPDKSLREKSTKGLELKKSALLVDTKIDEVKGFHDDDVYELLEETCTELENTDPDKPLNEAKSRAELKQEIEKYEKEIGALKQQRDLSEVQRRTDQLSFHDEWKTVHKSSNNSTKHVVHIIEKVNLLHGLELEDVFINDSDFGKKELAESGTSVDTTAQSRSSIFSKRRLSRRSVAIKQRKEKEKKCDIIASCQLPSGQSSC